jgi:hypothetical protein
MMLFYPRNLGAEAESILIDRETGYKKTDRNGILTISIKHIYRKEQERGDKG